MQRGEGKAHRVVLDGQPAHDSGTQFRVLGIREESTQQDVEGQAVDLRHQIESGTGLPEGGPRQGPFGHDAGVAGDPGVVEYGLHQPAVAEVTLAFGGDQPVAERHAQGVEHRALVEGAGLYGQQLPDDFVAVDHMYLPGADVDLRHRSVVPQLTDEAQSVTVDQWGVAGQRHTAGGDGGFGGCIGGGPSWSAGQSRAAAADPSRARPHVSPPCRRRRRPPRWCGGGAARQRGRRRQTHECGWGSA